MRDNRWKIGLRDVFALLPLQYIALVFRSRLNIDHLKSSSFSLFPPTAFNMKLTYLLINDKTVIRQRPRILLQRGRLSSNLFITFIASVLLEKSHLHTRGSRSAIDDAQ